MLSETLERNAAPPTVYRALDFLQTHGLVRRINSMSADIGCPHPEQPYESSLLICEQCHKTVELTGLCPNCRKPN